MSACFATPLGIMKQEKPEKNSDFEGDLYRMLCLEIEWLFVLVQKLMMYALSGFLV